jgi:hypothetical protein
MAEEQHAIDPTERTERSGMGTLEENWAEILEAAKAYPPEQHQEIVNVLGTAFEQCETASHFIDCLNAVWTAMDIAQKEAELKAFYVRSAALNHAHNMQYAWNNFVSSLELGRSNYWPAKEREERKQLLTPLIDYEKCLTTGPNVRECLELQYSKLTEPQRIQFGELLNQIARGD